MISVEPAASPELPPPDDTLRHLGPIRRLLELILLSLLVIGFYFAKDVVLPLLMGGILALTLSPTVRMLQRMGIAPPVTAVALILALGTVFGGGAMSGCSIQATVSARRTWGERDG